jgi:hypothetical protein
MNRRRQSEAARRFQERKRSEDAAARLNDEIPRLEALRLELDEYGHEGKYLLASHTRHIVVARAPALFVIPCTDSDCDGSYDLTRELLRDLRASEDHAQGEDECFGLRNKSTCHHRLRYRAFASYAALAPDSAPERQHGHDLF